MYNKLIQLNYSANAEDFPPLVTTGSDSLVFFPSMMILPPLLILQDKLFLNTLY